MLNNSIILFWFPGEIKYLWGQIYILCIRISIAKFRKMLLVANYVLVKSCLIEPEVKTNTSNFPPRNSNHHSEIINISFQNIFFIYHLMKKPFFSDHNKTFIIKNNSIAKTHIYLYYLWNPLRKIPPFQRI